MATTKIGFKIHGDYLTNLVRSFWVEGEPMKALEIMESGFPTVSPIHRMDVCLGKKKLVGVNDLTLVADDATEHNGLPLITLEEHYRRREAAIVEREADSVARAEMAEGMTEKIPSPWGLVEVPCSMLERNYSKGNGTPFQFRVDAGSDYDAALDRFERLFPDAVRDARTRTEMLMEERRQQDALRAAGVNPEQLKALQGNLYDVVGPALKPPPVDVEMNSLNGWLLPDGDYYPCRYFGHIALADALGATEGEAEKTWVKISNSEESPLGVQRGDIYPPPGGVTQAQLDAIFVWCERHGRKMPDNIVVRETR